MKVDAIKSEALACKLSPVINALVKAITDTSFKNITLSISADGMGLIRGTGEDISYDDEPVVVRDADGSYKLRTVVYKDIKTAKEELPWN